MRFSCPSGTKGWWCIAQTALHNIKFIRSLQKLTMLYYSTNDSSRAWQDNEWMILFADWWDLISQKVVNSFILLCPFQLWSCRLVSFSLCYNFYSVVLENVAFRSSWTPCIYPKIPPLSILVIPLLANKTYSRQVPFLASALLCHFLIFHALIK